MTNENYFERAEFLVRYEVRRNDQLLITNNLSLVLQKCLKKIVRGLCLGN